MSVLWSEGVFLLIIVACAGLWFWAGIMFCTARHRQRGINVDRWDVAWPDFPPAEWVERYKERSSLEG